MADITKIFGIPIRTRASVVTSFDNNPAPFRTNQNGEAVVTSLYPAFQQAAVEDAYFTFANTGTRGTGVNMTIAAGTTYASTQALAVIDNLEAVVGGRDIVLDYIVIKQDAVDTAGTAGFIYPTLDDGARYSSGGTAMTGKNASNVSNPAGNFYTGAITATSATSGARDLMGVKYSAGVGVADLWMCFKFGGLDPGMLGGNAVPATTAGYFTWYLPPVVIRPGKSFVLNEYKTSRNATGTGEFFLGAIIR